MRACLILDSKFPTQKAYGVTTLNTLKELSKLELSPVLFCASPQGENQQNYVQDFTVYHYRINSLTKKLNRISTETFGWKSRLAWNIERHLNFMAIRQQVSSLSPDIIWTRDEPIPFYISKKLKGVHVIEIHKNPNFRRIRSIRKLGVEKVILCPISESLKRKVEVHLPTARVVLAPMGVNPADITEDQMRSEITSHYFQKKSIIRIGYFGKLLPSGFSKGFEDLLELGLVLKKRNLDFKLTFVGLGVNEIATLTDAMQAIGLEEYEVEIFTHQIHSVGLQLMKDCDFLILPENRDPNYFGFPLKAMEYLASGRLVLAAKTRVNAELFSGTFQPFWYEPKLIHNLADMIQSTKIDSDLVEYLMSGVRYSTKYSWESRTTNITNAAIKLLRSRRFC